MGARAPLSLNKGLFLDRDGIVNEDFGYVGSIENFLFNERIFDLCHEAINCGYLIFIVTNQAGIGRGYYSESDFVKLTDWMIGKFLEQGIVISEVFYCPNHPVFGQGKYKKEDFDRKPNPGMLLKAIKKYSLDAKTSLMVGDKPTDVEAGQRAGIGTNILVTQVNEYQKINSPSVKIVKDISGVLKFF